MSRALKQYTDGRFYLESNEGKKNLNFQLDTNTQIPVVFRANQNGSIWAAFLNENDANIFKATIGAKIDLSNYVITEGDDKKYVQLFPKTATEIDIFAALESAKSRNTAKSITATGALS